MLVVFQGETGGNFGFPIDSSIAAVSGYLDVVSPRRQMYRYDGTVVSGVLYIAKSGLGQLPAADGYACLPQVIDALTNVYFLDPADLDVIEVPDFFSYAVLISGESVLVRLEALENAQGFATYTAGASGIQSAKLVALEGGTVAHADCTNVNHAGRIVGISLESASPGDQVRVQSINILASPLFNFPSIGAAMAGQNGAIVTSVPVNATFVQFVGVILDTQRINIFIDADAFML